MDEEIKNLLKENLEVSKKSLEILKKINRARQIALFFKLLYWILIILAIYYGYQFIQAYIDSIRQSLEILKNLPPDLLKNFKQFKL
jgi:hypothetical protein